MSRSATNRATRPAGFAVREKHIVKAICDLLELNGWTAIQTPAEAWLPSGRRVVRRGHGDYVFVSPYGGPLDSPSLVNCFFAEFKRPNATTDPQHLAEQERWQIETQAKGFLAYRCPDNCADPIAHFREWYSRAFGEAI